MKPGIGFSSVVAAEVTRLIIFGLRVVQEWEKDV